MSIHRVWLPVLCVALGCAARVRAQAPAQPPNVAEALQALAEAAKKGNEAAKSVDAKEMKALLPAALAGFKRTRSAAETQTAFGMRVSTATAEFQQEEGDGTLSIKLSDMAGMGAMAKMGMIAQEVDEETETGFRRTATIDGFKAEEEYDTADKHGSIKLIPGSHVIVEISGSGVSFETLKAALGKLDLKKVAALQPAAAPAAK